MIKAKPADDEMLAVRGQLMLKEQNPAGAIQTFLSIAGRQPANADVFVSLAEAYLRNDQRKEAVAAENDAIATTGYFSLECNRDRAQRWAISRQEHRENSPAFQRWVDVASS